MDRTTEDKFLQSFTTKVNLANPAGAMISEKLDREVMRTLKPMMDEMKAFRSSSVNRDTGKRETTYYYTGGRGIQQSVQAALDTIKETPGFDVAAPHFDISEQTRKKFTQTTERPLSTRAAAEIRAGVVKAGGTSQQNKETGELTYLVPFKAASRFHEIGDRGDIAYLSGELPSAIAPSSANIHERAQAIQARKVRTDAAMAEARRANPTPPVPPNHPDNPDNPNNPDNPDNPDNPNNPKNVKQREDDKRKAGQLAKGILVSAISTMIGLLGTAVGVLSKVLGGVLETARNTAKMMSDSARLNMSSADLTRLNLISGGMKLEKDVLPNVLGGLTAKFGTYGTLGPSLNQAAPLFQEMTPHLLDFAAGKANAEDFNYQIIADAMNISLSGRGGVGGEKLDPTDALAKNIALLDSDVTGGVGTEVSAYAAEKAQREKTGTWVRDTPYTAEEVKADMAYWGTGKGKPGKGEEGNTPAPPQPNDAQLQAAKEGTKAINDLKNIWDGLTNTYYTQMLGYIGKIVSLLEDWLRPYIAKLDPSAELATETNNRRANLQARADIMQEISLVEPSVAPYMKKATDKSLRKDPIAFGSRLWEIDAMGKEEATKALASEFPNLSYSAFKDLFKKGDSAAFLVGTQHYKNLKDNYGTQTLEGIGFGLSEKLYNKTSAVNESRQTRATETGNLQRSRNQEVASANSTLQHLDKTVGNLVDVFNLTSPDALTNKLGISYSKEEEGFLNDSRGWLGANKLSAGLITEAAKNPGAKTSADARTALNILSARLAEKPDNSLLEFVPDIREAIGKERGAKALEEIQGIFNTSAQQHGNVFGPDSKFTSLAAGVGLAAKSILLPDNSAVNPDMANADRAISLDTSKRLMLGQVADKVKAQLGIEYTPDMLRSLDVQRTGHTLAFHATIEDRRQGPNYGKLVSVDGLAGEDAISFAGGSAGDLSIGKTEVITTAAKAYNPQTTGK